MQHSLSANLEMLSATACSHNSVVYCIVCMSDKASWYQMHGQLLTAVNNVAPACWHAGADVMPVRLFMPAYISYRAALRKATYKP